MSAILSDTDIMQLVAHGVVTRDFHACQAERIEEEYF